MRGSLLAPMLLGPAILLGAAASSSRALAQTVSGTIFEDRDGDGIHDPNEPALGGVAVRLAGARDAGGAVDETVASGLDGYFSFAPGNGCYLLQPSDPPGWRSSLNRADGFPPSTPGYTFPVGRPRLSKLDQVITNLGAGPFRHTAMGDSIARNFNICSFPEAFWYGKQLRARLMCAVPAATISLDQAAVLGEHTDDLLVDDTSNLNNVFRAIEAQPDLITLSIIGNDMLDVDPGTSPTQELVNRAVAEILDARANLQESLSAMISEIPAADVVLNTLYDNEAYNCTTGAPSAFHRAWLPIVNRILRDLAWGQTRRVSINEVAAEFAHEDQSEACLGFTNMICRDFLRLDEIHPTSNGYTIVREKIWEASGGVNLGPKDPLGRTFLDGADYGYLRRVRRILPRTWEARDGASVLGPAAALDDQDGAAATITLGNGAQEFRLAGFPDWYDEIQIVRVLAGVRYRTAGTVNDWLFRMEGSVSGEFRPPPGHAYAATDWNYYTPIVGGGGPSQPPENPDYPNAEILALPHVGSWREVSAVLSKNPVLPPGAPDYEWPPVAHEDLATAAVRVVAAPISAQPGYDPNDPYRIDLDAAWLDLYGWEKTRPPEVGDLRVERLADGSLNVSFDPVPGAARYNVYFGRVATVHGGTYDHGEAAPAGPLCDAPAQSGSGGRLEILVDAAAVPLESAYVLVTAHVDDVESPAGTRSGGIEIDRSQSICR